jgi:hypothetical protein
VAVDYRKLALKTYPHICIYCGFGIEGVLEIAHLDGDHNNCEIANLAILCPTCHRMYDLDLISKEYIISTRDFPRMIRWAKLMKDAGAKAALTRKHREAGRKAARTRAKMKGVDK